MAIQIQHLNKFIGKQHVLRDICLTINDGEFDFANKPLKRAYVYAGAGTTVYINGGTFGTAADRDGYRAGILGDGTVVITGGTFGFDPTNWVAAGYEAVQNGATWTVQAK